MTVQSSISLIVAVAVALAISLPSGIAADLSVPPGAAPELPLTPPAAPESPAKPAGQSLAPNFDPTCLAWTDSCRSCQREGDGVRCSNPGIACQPAEDRCTQR